MAIIFLANSLDADTDALLIMYLLQKLTWSCSGPEQREKTDLPASRAMTWRARGAPERSPPEAE
jgi:hypothetical protein